MTQMGLLRWPKNTSTATATATTATSVSRSHGRSNSPNYNYSCGCCLSKILRKLKKRSRMLHGGAPIPSRQSSFQCRYDPLSYALNFDASGCGTSSEDEDPDYHRFYAFSSRFAATPKRVRNCPVLATSLI
ncbi:hypothetical protein Vadar_033604 [Vaccinium darrowii]|uniref:Uncharacterized protein n=1 Tax=Vaccinium darrowii TaxID=229202 RepID=A0ACB7XEE5_9ERIC|nr:hypothetical protein Vadar_033604 [Vaccinium darrowii]